MKTVIILILSILSVPLTAQSVLDLQPGPADGNDARIFNLDALANYGSDPDLIASQLDFSGEPGTIRSLIKFDLSSIPEGSVIIDARLSLYYNHESSTPGQLGNNAAYLRRVIQPWEESTVTWAPQPVHTTDNEVLIAASNNPEQDYTNIDVTALVRDMVTYSSTSHGFKFMLQDEEGGGKSMKFYSSDGAIPEKRPRLIVQYSPSVPTVEPESPNIVVMPNPFNTALSIKTETGGYNADILDANGKIVYSAPGGMASQILLIHDLGYFAPGLYFIRLTAGDKVYLKKIFKI